MKTKKCKSKPSDTGNGDDCKNNVNTNDIKQTNDIKNIIECENTDYYDSSDDSKKTDSKKRVKLVMDDERKKNWISMVDKLDSEYNHIVDVKKELDTSLDKLISIKTIKSYQKNVPRKKRETDLYNINRMEHHANDNNFMYNWWINCFFNCFKCRQVNHA